MKRTAAEVSVRQIETADDRFARVEKICWFACIYGTVGVRIKIAGEVRAAHAPVKVV